MREEGRGQRSEVRGQKSEVRGQRSEVRSQRSGVRDQRSEGMRINSAKDLIVYKKAYALAMDIYQVSKGFPKEERYALMDQIRRSSRSVCLNFYPVK